MLPSEKIKRIRDILVNICRLHGTQMPDKNLLHPRLFVVILLGLTCLAMQFYGFYYYWPDIMKVCNSLMLEPLGLQHITRLISRYFNDDEDMIVEVQNVIDNFYETEERDISQRKILSSRVKLIEFMMKLYMFVNALTFLTPVITSLILSCISNEYILFVPFLLPFTDPDDFYGFVANTIAMAFFSVMFYDLLVVQDMYFIYHTMQTISMSDILILKLNELSVKMDQVERNKSKLEKMIENSQTGGKNSKIINKNILLLQNSFLQLERHIIDIIKQYKSYNDFVPLFMPYMHLATFVALSTNAIGIGLSILVATFFSVSIGISVIMILTLQILMPCIQGTIISHQNQKILNAVWEFPWYKMPIRFQKIWLQFLHECQNTNELQITLIGVLNMEIFTEALNGAYSYFMYILNFVKH